MHFYALHDAVLRRLDLDPAHDVLGDGEPLVGLGEARAHVEQLLRRLVDVFLLCLADLQPRFFDHLLVAREVALDGAELAFEARLLAFHRVEFALRIKPLVEGESLKLSTSLAIFSS